MQNLRVATAPTLKLIQSLFHSLNAPHRKQSISLSSAEILSGHLSIKSIASVQLISQMIWPELNSPRCNGIHISFLLSIWASLNAPSPLFFKGALAAINTFCVVKKGHWHTGFTEWGQLKAAGTDRSISGVLAQYCLKTSHIFPLPHYSSSCCLAHSWLYQNHVPTKVRCRDVAALTVCLSTSMCLVWFSRVWMAEGPSTLDNWRKVGLDTVTDTVLNSTN